uniref:Uncharacterized protein n=1 Tax=Anguilla anguilla TaxID=7936 RepID=A0A0E9UWG3_ANGAN
MISSLRFLPRGRKVLAVQSR